MRNLIQKRKSEGFTIIEVMIVLAIAGLILLIVFLAVPALTRNAHNTSIKNDVAGILGAVNEYSNNNNGTKAPNNAAALSGTTVTIGASCGTPGANCATASVSNNITSVTVVSTVPGTSPAIGTVNIITGATCSGNTPTTTGATGRSVAAYFKLEGGAVQCQAS
jgi:prepilin-type N-terminal cleavage/methylation domain-containing protein